MFERAGNAFDFGRWLRGQNKTIAGFTRPNSLFLSTAAQNGHEQLSTLYEFFQSIGFVHSNSVFGMDASLQLAGDGLDGRVISFLDSINTGVVGYRKKHEKMPEEIKPALGIMKGLLNKVNNIEGRSIGVDQKDGDDFPFIELAHRTEHGEPVYIDLDLESAGTRRLLIVLGQAYRALDQGSVLCVDELDASLHTYASEAVLKLFCTPQTNNNGAQLVATTHDTNLMKSAALRRDQLWFAEKTLKGATEIYPLTDIRTRKGDNLELGYLQGRYGALPVDDPMMSRQGPS